MELIDKFKSRSRLYVPTSTASRAVTNWQRVLERPTTIVVERLGYAQQVRLSYARNVFRESEHAGETISREVVVYGVVGHPDPTVPDTVLMPNDVFRIDGSGTEYIIEDVIQVPGGIQAIARWSSP